MRHLSLQFSILTLVLLLIGCSKDKETTQTEDGEYPLTGTWELYKSWGGMSPLTIYPEGNGKELIFDSTTYKIVDNGIIVNEGTYQLINDAYTDVNSCAVVPAKDDKPNHIIYNNDPVGFKRYFELRSKKLRMTVSCIPVDGGVSEYRRKSALNAGN